MSLWQNLRGESHTDFDSTRDSERDSCAPDCILVSEILNTIVLYISSGGQMLGVGVCTKTPNSIGHLHLRLSDPHLHDDAEICMPICDFNWRLSVIFYT